jgi:hypothetical protein
MPGCMTLPTWAVAPLLRVAGATSRWLDRRLAIRIETDLQRQSRDNPDDYLLTIWVSNGTDHDERLRLLQLTFTGGAPPLDLTVPGNVLIDRLHSYKTTVDEWEVSSHENNYEHHLGSRVEFNGVRLVFHSGRDVWRPARGFRRVRGLRALRLRWRQWRKGRWSTKA